MNIFAYQEKGIMQGKEEMEDSILIDKSILSSGYHHFTSDFQGFIAIMDGIGGLRGSAFASSYVARSLADMKGPINTESIRAIVSDAHKFLCEKSKTGTTLTGIYYSSGNCFLIHIGNTRLSVLRNGYLMRHTEDQTEGTQLLKAGYLESEIPHNSFGVLTSCIGADPVMLRCLEIKEFEITANTRIVITSDGIHDFLSEEELELQLQTNINEQLLTGIARQARDNGSEDDISLIIMEC